MQCITTEYNQIKTAHYDETKKRALDSQIDRAKENLKLSYDESSQRQASGINQRIKALRQGHHWIWGLTNGRAIKEETIAINCDWVYNQVCSLSHDIHVIFHFL